METTGSTFPDPFNTSSILAEDTWLGGNITESEEEEEREYIFDRLYIRLIFIGLYSVVFCFCFFGNLMVILVVTLHWRMRNITKFCLANLAFADLCVGVFCVYQNLSTYLINSWVLGEFLCKMYQFINSLSHTASILIMVVMCVERYLAILHPFRCKQLLTINRLRVLIVTVWLASAIYSSPKLYYIATLKVFRLDGSTEIICTARRTLYDSRTFDMIHFFLLFLLPLVVITVLYTRVGVTLWKSSKSSRLPWTGPGQGGMRTTSSSLSRSSSSGGTVNEESSTSTCSSRGTSVRMTRIRSPSTKNSQILRRRRHHGRHHNFRRCSIDHHNDLSVNLNSSLCKNSGRNGRPNSQSFVVTIENKCHVVGSNDIRVMDVGLDGLRVEPDANGHARHSTTIFFAPSEDPEAEGIGGQNNNDTSGRDGDGMKFSRPYSFKRKRAIKRLSRAKNLRGGREALKSRQTVVRMLIVIVVTFAVCNLPFHLRKMLQYWWPNYDYVSIFSTLATPLTHLIMYANCAINPIIYAFMSKTFWSSFKELICCHWKKHFQSSSAYREPSTQTFALKSPRINSRSEERD